MKKFFIVKKVIFGMLAVVLLTALLPSCSSSAPELDEVKEEFVSLIEASGEINTILFGEGLPVYQRDGSEEEAQIYSGISSALDAYEYIREDSKFLTVDQIKEASDLVYTAEYLEPVYQMMFDGFADEATGVSSAKFLEWDGWLYQNTEFEAYITETRIYNYDSMKIVKPSSSDYVNVEIESSLGGESSVITLAFSKTADGWRLDTPTY